MKLIDDEVRKAKYIQSERWIISVNELAKNNYT